LNFDSRKQFKVSRGGFNIYEKASSRNTRISAASENSDSRDLAIPLNVDDSDSDDKNTAASKRSKILKQGMKSMKVHSEQQQLRRSNSVTLLAEAGRKRKAPPPLLAGDDTIIDLVDDNGESSTMTTNAASSSLLPTTRNEQQHHQQQQPVIPLTLWSSMTKERRDELLTKIKNTFVYEAFRQFGNGKNHELSIKNAQKEYWKRRLVDSDNDDGKGKGDVTIRLSKDDFHLVWKEVKKLLKEDDTLTNAISGFNKGKQE